MPDLDTATFQAVILGLLLFSTLTLLGILLSLRGIKKVLKRGLTTTTANAERAEERAERFEPALGAGAAGNGHGPAGAAGGESLAEAGTAADVAPDRAPAPERQRLAEQSPQQAAPLDEAAFAGNGSQVVEPHPLDTAASEQAAVAATSHEEPQEQPFERDGRWWFRRGEELLVYDEQTGQWEPALVPQLAGAPASVSPAATGAAQATASPTPSSAASTHDAGPAENTGAWKCPTCGAVNGSTAPSCRMCFSDKP